MISRGSNKTKTVITYETDNFGRTTKETTVTRKQQHEQWYPNYETHILSNYDDNSNISKIETKSRKKDEAGCRIPVISMHVMLHMRIC